MLQLGLSASEQASLNAALIDPRRQVRFTAQLYNKAGNPLPKQITVLDGEVVIDHTRPKEEPTRTAFVTILDPHRQLVLDVTDPLDGGLWFSKSMRLYYGIYVRSLARWVDIPVFHGGIFEVSRHGIEVDIDLQGKDAQHLPPYVFPRSFEIKRNTRMTKAIRYLFEARGETQFDLAQVNSRLARTKTWLADSTMSSTGRAKKVGDASPWRAGQNFADAVDHQLFYRGNGRLKLRKWPETPVWKFKEGDGCIVVDDADERYSIADVYNMVIVRGERTVRVQVNTETKLAEKSVVGDTTIKVASAKEMKDGRKIVIGGGSNPETRTIAGSYTSGSKNVPLTRALSRRHAVGAKVVVRHREDVARPVIGRASLTQAHPLSSQALTGGKRPRVRIEDRPNIHKKKQAQKRADKIMKRMKVGTEQDIEIAVAPIPHLEEGDIVKVDVNGIEKRFRLKTMTIPLNPNDSSTIGWTGRRVPRKRRRNR